MTVSNAASCSIKTLTSRSISSIQIEEECSLSCRRIRHCHLEVGCCVFRSNCIRQKSKQSFCTTTTSSIKTLTSRPISSIQIEEDCSLSCRRIRHCSLEVGCFVFLSNCNRQNVHDGVTYSRIAALTNQCYLHL